MQSFRSSAAPNADSKRSFGIFGTMIRKPKSEPAQQSQPLSSQPPKLELPQLAPTPPVEEAPKEPAPRQRRVTKKPSADVDDELRKHLQREGFAFLAFTDPDKAAGISHTPPTPKPKAVVVDPVESSRRDGTLLKDAIERMEKTNIEASRSVPVKVVEKPKPTHTQRPPVRIDSPLDTSRSIPEQPRQTTPAVLKKEKSPDRTSPVVAKVEGSVMSRPRMRSVPSASTAGNSSGARTTAERTPPVLNSQQPGSAATVTARYSSNGSTDRKGELKTSDKSQTESGMDMGMDSQDRSANGKPPARNDSPRSETPAEAPARIPESPAMARFAQEASMQDVDPRKSVRNPGNHNQHIQPRRTPPTDSGRHSGQEYENGLGSRTQSYERLKRRSPLPMNVEGNRSLQSLTVDEEDSSLDESQSSNLPVPVMLPPDEYKVVPNQLQRTCIMSHRSTVMSSNVHHRICCMVCQTDSSAERWLCTYCALRFCSRCKAEFTMGNTVGQIMEKAASEDWRSQSSSPPSPVRGAPEKNIPWELACVMEAGGRLQLRSPPRPPPQSRRVSPVYPNRGPSPVYSNRGPSPVYSNRGPSPANRSGKSSPHSLSPDERAPTIRNQPPSPTWSDQEKAQSRNSSRNGYRYEDTPAGYDREARRKTVQRIMKDGGNMSSAARSSSAVLSGSGTAAEQRRALLHGASY